LESLPADVVVVGLGPAGLAAVVRAAESEARVVAVDEGAAAGGQIWRDHVAKPRRSPRLARQWRTRLGQLPKDACRILTRSSVVDAPAPGVLVAAGESGVVRVEASRIVMATGARELFLPFPGWTRPGVVGVGGAQALVKSGASVGGRRALVAGSGPLLLPVAATLAHAGARVVAVLEQAPRARLVGFARGLGPRKLLEAARYRLSFATAPYRTGAWITAVDGPGERVEVATVTDGQRTWTERCDLVASAYGLVPNLELPRLLGCRIEDGAVAVDEVQLTSVPDVFAAGELTGIGGAEKALLEGEIAGLAAADRRAEALALRERRDALLAFARRLREAFALRPELRALATPATIACRCEDVAFDRLRPQWTPRQAKLYTRAGMGPCQGRVCGAAFEFLFGWPPDTVRPPLIPVTLEALKEADS
jgi:NADPH-dependent 2,4-dienoyl-CoA reductase/sulfur reductase-like enzyme